MPMTILAVLTEVATAQTCLDGALAAASVDDSAKVEVFHVLVDPTKLIAAPEEIAIQHMREHDEGTARHRALAIRAVYDHWLERLFPDQAEMVRWREVVGQEEEMLLTEAKDADLLVMARPHNMDGGDAMHAAVFGSCRPLLVPPDWTPVRPDAFGRHIAIAWKPTPQAHRAVEGAGPWLRRAERVSSIIIARDAETSGVNEAEHLARELGFSAETVLIAPGQGDLGEQLLEQARILEADALVLGAYRHNEYVEWALPSTTRYVLRHTRIPLFLAH